MPGAPPFAYSDFSGGLNTRSALFLLQDNQARDLLNVQGTEAGAIVKRPGVITFATPTVALNSLAAIESTTSPFLIGAGGGKIVSVNAGGTVTQLATGLDATARWEFVQAPANGGQGTVFGMNGVDAPIAWDGAAGSTVAWTSTSGTVPNGKYCLAHQNQVFVAGVAAHPSRVYWSGLQIGTGALARDWDPAANFGAGFLDLDPDDGQAISALGTVGPYVLIAKPRKLWILYDVPNGAVRVLSSNVGVIAHRSLAVGAEGTYFLSEDRGVFVTNGSKLSPLSDNIQPTIDQVSGGAKQFAAGTYFNSHYYLSVGYGTVTTTTSSVSGGSDPSDVFGGPGAFGGAGTFGGEPSSGGTTTVVTSVTTADNTVTLDYDAVLQSWWKHSVGSNQFAVWHPQDVAQLYSAKAGQMIVDLCFQPGATTDNGQPITWSWMGPWQSPTFYRRRRFPTPYFRKRIRQVRFGGLGTVDFSLAKDMSDPVPIRSNVFGGATLPAWARVYSIGVGSEFSVVLGATSSTQDLVHTYVLMVTDRRDLVPA